MIRKSVLLLAALVFAASARAQFAFYTTATVVDLSNIQSSPRVTSGVAYKNAIDPLGFTLGVSDDFLQVGPVKLGLDARFSHETTRRGAQVNAEGSGARLYSGLGGVRAVFHTKYTFLRPYAEAAAGLGRSDYGFLVQPNTSVTFGQAYPVNNFQYNVFAGADFSLASWLDFRAVELGYGGLSAFGAYSHNYPLKSITTGVVFHLPSN